MSDWKQGDINGQNEKLVSIAEKITKMAKASIMEKITALRALINSESKKCDSEELDSLSKHLEKLEKQYNKE